MGRVLGALGGGALGGRRVAALRLGWLRAQTDLRQPPAGPETAFLGMGGNVGDRLHYLNRAVALLDGSADVTVEDVSSVYETEPVTLPGAPDGAGGPFLNIAVRILTTLAPLRLLRACQSVESTLGRVRTTRWGPRTVDVDVLLYGDRSITTPVLTVPHAELTARAFALVPLMEVAPGWQLPDGRSLASVIATLAPIEGVSAIGRQVSLQPLPSGPPSITLPSITLPPNALPSTPSSAAEGRAARHDPGEGR